MKWIQKMIVKKNKAVNGLNHNKIVWWKLNFAWILLTININVRKLGAFGIIN